MERIYRIGTRTSPLALRQVEEVVNSLKRFYPEFSYEIVGINTYGDKDKVTPISKMEGTDFFTREIEEALLKGEIDLAVHSAKDLPDQIPEGLIIAAITESIDPDDVLVSKKDLKLNELPRGAKVGTSSLRRKTQLQNHRKDFRIIDIRGNIEERLKLLDETDLPRPCTQGRGLDAIVIAAAGLVRLGLKDRITQRIPFEILEPHPLQGRLAIEVREGDYELQTLVEKLDSHKKILFVCLENACRSQMAEGIFNHLAKARHKAFSAGISLAKKVNPLAIEVMEEIGIDITQQKPKLLDLEMIKNMDMVISMGCIDNCPTVEIDENWGIEDPKDKGIEKFREVREIIYQRVKDLTLQIEEDEKG